MWLHEREWVSECVSVRVCLTTFFAYVKQFFYAFFFRRELQKQKKNKKILHLKHSFACLFVHSFVRWLLFELNCGIGKWQQNVKQNKHPWLVSWLQKKRNNSLSFHGCNVCLSRQQNNANFFFKSLFQHWGGNKKPK